MDKNTVLLLLFLCLLALGAGYSKFVLIPRYNLTQIQLLTTPVSPSPTTLADSSQTASDSEKFQPLTDRQKIAQLISLPVNIPTASNSAMYDLISEVQPGFVTLTGQVTATASVNKTVTNVQRLSASNSAIPIFFAVKKPGKVSEPCLFDPKCLAILNTFNINFVLSDQIEVASTSAKQAVAQLQLGKAILDLSPKLKSAQILSLLDDLTNQYQQDDVFKPIVDAHLLQLFKIKQEYY